MQWTLSWSLFLPPPGSYPLGWESCRSSRPRLQSKYYTRSLNFHVKASWNWVTPAHLVMTILNRNKVENFIKYPLLSHIWEIWDWGGWRKCNIAHRYYCHKESSRALVSKFPAAQMQKNTRKLFSLPPFLCRTRKHSRDRFHSRSCYKPSPPKCYTHSRYHYQLDNTGLQDREDFSGILGKWLSCFKM